MKVMNEEKLKQMGDYINQYIEENNGISPSFTEIIEFMGMSKSVGYRYLTTLRDRGIVEYSGRNTLAVKDQDLMKTSSRRLSIFGTIPCGTPEDYRQDIEGYISIPNEWIDGNCYLLRATGDSMIDIGIDEGDLVLIKVVQEAYSGQVVAVLTEDGTTLKRYMLREDNVPWLLAENKSYPKEKRELHPKQIIVQGLALKIIKNINEV